MILLLVLLILPSVQSYERIVVPSTDRLVASSQYDRLTKLLSVKIYRTNHDELDPDYNKFFADFWSDYVSYNVTQRAYSTTCFNVYLELKLSPFEIQCIREELVIIDELKKGVNASQNTPSVNAPTSRMIFIVEGRREALRELSRTLSPEVRSFAQDIDKIASAFISEVLPGIVRFEVGFQIEKAFAQKKTNLVATAKEAIVQIALKYKLLPNEAKIELERELCARNSLRWLNSDLNGLLDEYSAIFWNTVGLDVNSLIKVNAYLSNFTVAEVKGKFMARATELNMKAQEYVDLCTKVIKVMQLRRDKLELQNRNASAFIGSHWGQRVYNSSDELFDKMCEEGAPFANAVIRQSNFFKNHPMGPHVRSSLREEENILFDNILKTNNDAATDGTNSIPVPSWRFFNGNKYDGYNYWSREQEKALCYHSALESITLEESAYFKSDEWKRNSN